MSDIVWVYTFNIVVSLLVVFLLAGAAASEWKVIRWPWKGVLGFILLEHLVIAYGNFEAKAEGAEYAIPPDTRFYLMAVTMTGLALALAIVSYVAHTTPGWRQGYAQYPER